MIEKKIVLRHNFFSTEFLINVLQIQSLYLTFHYLVKYCILSTVIAVGQQELT